MSARSLSSRLRATPLFLGSGTWANLTTALGYSNGSGAQAALPVGTTYIATDIGKNQCLLTLNAAKTRWVPVGGTHILATARGSLAAPINTWAAPGTKYAWPGGDVAIPAVMGVGDSFGLQSLTQKRGAAGTYAIRFRLGTTGTYNTDAQIHAVGGVGAPNLRGIKFSQTAIISGATTITISGIISPAGEGTNTVSDQTTNFNIASVMYPIVEITAMTAGDFIDLMEQVWTWSAT